MSRFFGYDPYFGFGFQLAWFLVVCVLPVLAFLLLVFVVFKYGTRLGKVSLMMLIALAAIVYCIRFMG